MVAMNVWPTDAADGSVANEDRWRKMARHWAPSGVALGIGGELVPTLSMPNLTVQSGACWVDGHYCELAGPQVLTATANGLAVVRFDPVANSAELLWRDAVSTPTQNPAGTWELPIARTVSSVLADVRVNSFVAQQGVPRFANATARTNKIPAPYLNQLSLLDNRPGLTQYWNGSAWVDTDPVIPPVPYIQAGSSVLTTDAFGTCQPVFPVAFGAPPTSIGICGDGNIVGSFWVSINPAGAGAVTSFAVICKNAAGVVGNTVLRINWIATGARP